MFLRRPCEGFYCAVTSDRREEKNQNIHSNNTTKRNVGENDTVVQFCPYFFCFLKILKVCECFLRPESVSSPVEPLSSSRGLFFEEFWGMRLPAFPPVCPVGDGVSGSVEFGLREREDSDMDIAVCEPWISLMLADFSKLDIFFINMGLSEPPSGEVPPSCTRLPPLGV